MTWIEQWTSTRIAARIFVEERHGETTVSLNPDKSGYLRNISDSAHVESGKWMFFFRSAGRVGEATSPSTGKLDFETSIYSVNDIQVVP